MREERERWGVGRVWEENKEIGGNGRIMEEVRESFINNSILPFFWRRQIGNLHPWYCRLNDLKKMKLRISQIKFANFSKWQWM